MFFCFLLTAIEKIRQRWKSIRDSYVKYLNKKDRSGNLSRVRPYKFEKQLKFLKPFLSTPRESISSQQGALEEFKIESADQLLSVSQYNDDGQSSSSCEYQFLLLLEMSSVHVVVYCNEGG